MNPIKLPLTCPKRPCGILTESMHVNFPRIQSQDLYGAALEVDVYGKEQLISAIQAPKGLHDRQ